MKKYTYRNIIEYLKDNPEGYWFKRKLYGWGWTPATREGWIVTFLFILLVVANVLRFERGGYQEEEIFTQVLIPTLVLIALFIFITIRTGEPPKWTWGRDNENDKDSNTTQSQ